MIGLASIRSSKMQRRTITTKAGGYEYEVSFQAFGSLEEARDIWAGKGDNPDEVLLSILNAQQEQNAKQGGKSGVLKAIRDGGDAEAVASAVEAAQAYAAGYIIGSPRGGTLTSGITKTAAKDLGVQLASQLGAEELAAIMEEHGITL